jgi:hypothetical protein
MLLDGGKRARAIAIWQASCELEIVPSLHSNLGVGATSATGGGLAGAEEAGVDEVGTAAGEGACATSFWKSAHPAHDNMIDKARAERTCGASGEIPRLINLALLLPTRQRAAVTPYNGEA